MRAGVTLSVSSADLDRLRTLVNDRNAPQKHVWRARIVLLTAEGDGTSAIMRETSKSKTCVWRCQERFADEGFEGLLRDDIVEKVRQSSGRWRGWAWFR
jgi:Homeodomain-like domain